MRVNIEEQAWKRIYQMALDSALDVRQVVGTVALLWSNSQDEIMTHGTRDQIVRWAKIHRLEESQIEMWITELEKGRFISCGKDGKYKIHGNEVQLASIAKLTKRASKGGQALKKKMRELRLLKEGNKPASGHPEDAKRGAIQFNSSHYNSIQFNSNASNVDKLAGNPIFKFVDLLHKDDVDIDGGLVRTVVARIHDDIHPRKSKTISNVLKRLPDETEWTFDGLKWLLLAAVLYRDYCATNAVEKVFGFSSFMEQWTSWVPDEFSEVLS